MGEINLTINAKALERFIFIAIIGVLGVMLGLKYLAPACGLDIGNNVTGAVIAADAASEGEEVSEEELEATAAEIEEPEPVAAAEDERDPTCFDGIKNQNEEGTDCGGPCQGHWYDGKCNQFPAPSCDDGIKNQDEDGVDCGGTCSGYWYDDGSGEEECHTKAEPKIPKEFLAEIKNIDCEYITKDDQMTSNKRILEIEDELKEVEDKIEVAEENDADTDGLEDQKRDLEGEKRDIEASLEDKIKFKGITLEMTNGLSDNVDLELDIMLFDFSVYDLRNIPIKEDSFTLASKKTKTEVYEFTRTLSEVTREKTVEVKFYDDGDFLSKATVEKKFIERDC